MKKTLSILLALVMLLGCFSVSADDVTSKAMQDALVKVKTKVAIPAEFSEFTPYSYEYDDSVTYNFNWNKEEGNGYIEISCDGEGRISSYHFYDNFLTDSNKLNKVSKSEIVDCAKAFVKKTFPETYKENDVLVFDDASWSVLGNYYTMNFVRMNNGVEVKDNYANVRISVCDDAIYVRSAYLTYNYETEFFYNTENGEFSPEAKYSEEFPVEIIYRDVVRYTEEDKDKTVLVYRNKDDEAGYILVSTGDVVTEDAWNYGSSAGGGGSINSTMKDEAAPESVLTEKELKELETIKGVMSKEDADKIIKTTPGLKVSSDREISSWRIQQRDDEYFVSFSYNTEDEKPYVSATMEALTGKLIRYSSGRISEYNDTDVITEKQKYTANKEIDKFLTTVAPDEFEQSEFYDEYSDEYNYISKSYDRYVNDIRYINDGIDVTYNVLDYAITNYSLDFEDKTFKDPQNAMSAEDAYKALYKIAPLKKIWLKTNGKYQLCYTLDRYNVMVDAESGEEYKQYKSSEQKSYTYSDIKGHWAEEKITKLGEIQIGLEGEKFNPDAPITQYDLLRLFGAAVYGQSYITYDEDDLYRDMVRMEVIKEEDKNPNAQVLREDAFVYMVRLDGLEKVAKLSDIFKVEYADGNLLSEGKIGYPAILTGMGIICGNGGYLKPKTPITRAEAMVMVYNYMINAD